MIPFPLSFVVNAVRGSFSGDVSLLSRMVGNVTIDSRTAEKGSLYVPIIGNVHDGHKFIASAFQKGALCVLSDRPLPGGVPHILVEDTTEALQRLAEEYLLLNRKTIVAVTGSVGKTSTKEMLHAVLSKKFSCYHTPGNLNNQTGVPQAVFQIGAEHDLAVLELGTNHPGEIRALSRIVKPDICVLTNIGVAHIEFFGSRENIFLGKTEILEYMQPGGTVVANGDDDFLPRIPGALLYGLGKNCRVRAADVEDLGLSGTRFSAAIGGKTVSFRIPAPGIFHIYNALAAIAVGSSLGMTAEELREGVSSYRSSAGRMNVVSADGFTVLDDSYNANPESMRSAIRVLGKADGRHVCILGDMKELGERSPEFHEQLGAFAAESGCDLLLFVGQYAEDMTRGADSVRGGISRRYAAREDLEKDLPGLIRRGDSVLVKASHGVHLEKTVEFLLGLSV